MSASATDKFKKVAPNTGWQIGGGGVADASVTTIPLVSSTSLPTGTGVILTVDRVDSSGAQTPTKMERIVGVISGTNVISCVRGIGGTAQAHSPGAVVEIVIDSVLWNDLMDGILVGHGQDGAHLPNLPLTTPKITTAILDANGNEVIKTPATASAVNEVTVTNAATGGVPTISATGNDTNIHLALTPKGNGLVKMSVLRQDYTSNAYVPSSVILTGWGWKLGDGSTAMSSAVTFGLNFSSAPIVVVGTCGQRSASDPTVVGDLNSQPGYYVCEGYGLAVGGLTVGMSKMATGANGAQSFTNTIRYGYTWIAIGVL